MRKLRELWMRVLGLLGAGTAEADLEAELQSHVQMHMEDSVRSGLSQAEARRRALIYLGGMEQTKGAYRQQRGLPFVESLVGDVRYALRQLAKNPGFMVTAVLTLALGIGANTAIFTLVHAVLLKDLPVVDPKALVRVGDGEICCTLNLGSMRGAFSIFSYEGYKYLRDRTPEMEELAAMQGGMADLSVRRASGDTTSHSAFGEFVSGNYFQTFGVHAVAGRTLTPSDDADGATPVAMLSYHAWVRDYARDPSVVGSSLLMNTHPVTILGVTPQGFYGDRLSVNPPDFYLPISQEPTLGFYGARDKSNLGWLFLIGRVKPAVAIASLQEKMSGLLRQSLGELKDFQTTQGKARLAQAHVVLAPGGAGIAGMQHEMANRLHLLMGLAGLVLLIACANIANLMLARGVAQRGEISVRMALGAARSRIIRQRLTESLVLACMGGVAGIAVSYAGTKMLLSLLFTRAVVMPVDAVPSLPVLGFAFGVSLVTGVSFGVGPAWMTSNEQPVNAMRGANRSTRDGSSLLQRGLVVLQAALSLVLLVGAGLLGMSLNHLQHQNFGLEAENRVVVTMNPLKAGYKPERLQGLYSQIEDRFHAMPGVKHVGLTLYTPLCGDTWSFYVYPQGQRAPDPGQEVTSYFNRASSEYFQSVGQRVVRGRPFTAADTATAPKVAVVNEAFVKKVFADGKDPLGRRFGANEIKHSGDFEIVGVVEDTKYEDARSDPAPMYFTPMLQPSGLPAPGGMDASLYAEQFVLQMNMIPPELEAEVRRTMASIDPNLTVDRFQTFAEQIGGNFDGERTMARLTQMFGLLALVLASVGLYGVTSYTVAGRTSEIGIRMALGAKRGDVVRMILRGAMLQAGLGLLIGVPAALLSARLVKSQLYGVTGQDLGVLSAATLVLALAAWVAGWIPARRAASVDPMRALRTE
ncbi:ABC transporter permease [Terriglobus saanensis]|uniref:Permease n=1 Tax=Terriglobus saanensis (strain ATCC BAA-1853 / DSM 23119 / SP1PR4) TaxID=401053 RepID=E8UXB2_TERSS|nr:ABC transporter permease [Terriglobus saanensis]ADV84136.1 permease [Terriglobus saanensis SP1PR4]